jgi:hypothetical protein
MRDFIKESVGSEKPMWLPQMKCGIAYVKNELEKQGLKHGLVKVSPKELMPLQPNVKKSKMEYFKEMVDNNQPLEPIYVSDDNHILDGHHRAYAFMNDPQVTAVVCLKLYMDSKDAARVLNKIQDKYDFETNFDPESDDILNFDKFTKNSPEYSNFDVDKDGAIKEEDEIMDFSAVKNNPKTLTCYKSQPINTKAKTGDFLVTEKKKNFNHKYDINFDNLLEIKDEELQNYASPIDYIVEKWFAGVNMKEESVKKALTQETHTYREINEKAKKMGYDGIKYGKKFLHLINK